ncbi:MAG TPA: ATP-binding protein, partial [Haloplasmataceae bacterium]
YTQLTQKIGFDNLEKVKEYFENIQNSSDILLQKVNDILDFSKIESKHFKLLEKPTNISKLVKEVYDLLKIQADRKNLNFSYILDPYLPEYLEIDEIRLKQVLINICSNAIKFTDKGSVKMQVKVFGYTNDAIYLEYIISDTGIGIPKDKIDTIFVPFVQANNSNDYPGTGLGLAIARDIIRLMGGDINVVSKENVGSIFSFITKFKITSYYRQKVSEMIDVDNDTFSALIKDKKILVCEDNLINQVLIKEIFALFNKKDIDIAKDGFEAINKCKDKLYDCILMDIKMPNLNGLEATKIIKNLIQYKNVPIIALTANVFSDQIKEYLLVGMIDYLSKPIDIKKLKNVLYQQLVVGD